MPDKKEFNQYPNLIGEQDNRVENTQPYLHQPLVVMEYRGHRKHEGDQCHQEELTSFIKADCVSCEGLRIGSVAHIHPEHLEKEQ